jgi:hypothetical protein
MNSGNKQHCAVPLSNFEPSERLYKLTVQNQTPDTLDEVIVFYRMIDASDKILYQSKHDLYPDASCVFQLGVAKKLESYVLGAFIGKDLVTEARSEIHTDPKQYAYSLVIAPK